MQVDISKLPREHGFPIGQYHLRYSTINVTMPGAKFVGGKTVEPITGRVLQRLRMAYGSTCVIETADAETAKLVRKYWKSIGHSPQAKSAAPPRPQEPPRAKPEQEQQEPEQQEVEGDGSGEALPELEDGPRTADGSTWTETVDPNEPVIDFDVDSIEDEDVLRAMASGLGLETDGVDIPQLRLNIRKKREPEQEQQEPPQEQEKEAPKKKAPKRRR